MALPDRIRVKLSSEAAEGISITPVVAREMPLRELVEYMLGVTGKDAARPKIISGPDFRVPRTGITRSVENQI